MPVPRWPLILAALTVSCSLAAPNVEGGEDAPLVAFEPSDVHGAVPSDVRLLISGASVGGAAPALYRGTLSATSLGQIVRGEPSANLRERHVETVSWLDAGTLVLAPVVSLSAGTYTLVGAAGRLREFEVTSEAPSGLRRLWPEPGVAAAPLALYCAPSGDDEPWLPTTVELEPGALPAEVEPFDATVEGYGACALMRATGPVQAGSRLVPPRAVGSRILGDPPWLIGERRDGSAQALCPEGALSLGALCLSTEGEVLLLSASESLLVMLSLDGREPRALSLGAGTRAEVPLRDCSDTSSKGALRGEIETLDLAGNRSTADLSLWLGSPTARPRIEEVLANPLGAEPSAEWVELGNPGCLPVELEGWTLGDESSQAALPRVALAPGERLLVVNAGSGLPKAPDVSADSSVRWVEISNLGGRGLSNSGEALRLSTPEGRLVSTFPAVAASVAGVSVARCQDGGGGRFALHAAPGASPGGANTCVP